MKAIIILGIVALIAAAYVQASDDLQTSNDLETSVVTSDVVLPEQFGKKTKPKKDTCRLRICPKVYEPLCAECNGEWKTFSNTCYWARAVTRNKTNWRIIALVSCDKLCDKDKNSSESHED